MNMNMYKVNYRISGFYLIGGTNDIEVREKSKKILEESANDLSKYFNHELNEKIVINQYEVTDVLDTEIDNENGETDYESHFVIKGYKYMEGENEESIEERFNDLINKHSNYIELRILFTGFQDISGYVQSIELMCP